MFKRQEKQEWCCRFFQTMYDRPGKNGFSIVVQKNPGVAYFLLQARAVDKGRESEVDVPTTVPLLFVSQISMQFCPSCGVNLKEWYGDRIEGMYSPGLALDISG